MNLYKYKKLNENCFNDIENKRLFITNFNNMNDEDDGIGIIDHDLFKQKFEEIKNIKNFTLCYDEAITCFKHYIRDFLFCASFCKSKLNKYLWKKYADYNKGICIEYAFNEIKQALKKQNIYSEKRKIEYKFYNSYLFEIFCNFLMDNHEAYYFQDIDFLFKKFPKWKKEKEYRIFIFTPQKMQIKNGCQYIYLENLKPKKIYFGKNISYEDAIRLKQLCIKLNIDYELL